MRHLLSGAALAALAAGSAVASGVERSTQSVGILFEEGKYAEVSFSYFNPDVSGSSAILGPTLSSGDMLASFTNLTLGYKQALSDRLDIAIVLDQPIGANVDYPNGTNYPIQGTTADLQSNAITGFLRYKLPSNFSVIGGVRAMRTSGEATITTPPDQSAPPYTLETSTETDFGYVVGIAWEKPEIAARVALTYNSAITHDFVATESSPFTGGLPVETTFSTEIPESINLEFQTGIAADTLLFGSIRWVNWTEFTIDPDEYRVVYPEYALVEYDSDRITYNLGLGRKFNETWSGAVLFGYEESNGKITGNLGPNDGYRSVGLALTYTQGNAKVTGGVRYAEIGDATTRSLNGDFEDNHGWGFGLRLGMSF